MNRNRKNINEVASWFPISPQKGDEFTWSRPSDWVALPAVNVGDEKFVGLFAVYNTVGSNLVAVQCQGIYDVDWGDGTSSLNVASDSAAEHEYDYADLAGTECSRGYRQAVITITPAAGQHLTKIQIDNRHSTMSQAYTAPWLDIKVAGSYIATHKIYVAGNVWMRMLESYEFVGTNLITSFASCFYNCHALQKVIHYTNAGTNFASMFNACYKLRHAPALNTGAGTDLSGLFYKCFDMVYVPLLDTHSATTFQNMFYQCLSMKDIPLFNSSNVSNFTGMFYGCYSLLEAPFLDTSAGTGFSGMFQGAQSLQKVPLYNTANGTNFSAMFYNCFSLREVPLLNTAKGTNFSSMFYSCGALQSVPLFDLHLGTDVSSMFIYCVSLTVVPLFVLTAATNLANMFSNCNSLPMLPLLVVSAGTSFTTIFSTCYSLQKGSLSGTTRSISYLNCKIGHDELVDLIDKIGNASGAQTLTLTGNPGTASLTAGEQAVATGKGWTLAL
jgi:hypothetical protein